MTLLALCLGWVAGIALQPRFDSPLWVWLTAGAALTAADLLAVRGRARWTLLTSAAFAFGAARMRATAPRPGPSFIGYYVNRTDGHWLDRRRHRRREAVGPQRTVKPRARHVPDLCQSSQEKYKAISFPSSAGLPTIET